MGWRSKSRTKTFVRTRPPASCKCALLRFREETSFCPTAQADRWWPRLSRTATPARMNSQVKGHPQTSQEQDSERLRINPEHAVHRHAHEWSRSKGSTLGRRSACCGIGNTFLMACKLRDSTSRAARDCHPCLGWFGSTSPCCASSSAVPVARSSQEVRCLLVSTVAFKNGVEGIPLSSPTNFDGFLTDPSQ